MLIGKYSGQMFDGILDVFGTSVEDLQDTAAGSAVTEFVKSKWREGLMIGLVGGIVIGMKFLK